MRIATTEAGNLPYWVDAEVLDLVGLNSRDTAREPPSRALLEAFAPDLVLVHPADGLDRAHLERDDPDLGREVVRLEAPLRRYVTPERARFYAEGLPRYRDLNAENTQVAPIVTFAFLDAHAADYDVYAVPARTGGGLHVIAVRRAWPERDEVLRSLLDTETHRRAPYLRVSRRMANAR